MVDLYIPWVEDSESNRSPMSEQRVAASCSQLDARACTMQQWSVSSD